MIYSGQQLSIHVHGTPKHERSVFHPASGGFNQCLLKEVANALKVLKEIIVFVGGVLFQNYYNLSYLSHPCRNLLYNRLNN